MAAEDRRNRNEQIKEALDPLDLRLGIDRYAREGLASIDPDDLNIRFLLVGPVHPAAGRGRPLHAAHPHPRGAR